MTVEQLDLNAEIVKEMKSLQFSQSSIDKFCAHRHYVTSLGQQPMVQKTYLTLALAHFLNSASFIAPSEIRLGLSMGTNPLDWLTDVKVIVLPFLKANEDQLFA